MTMLSFRIDDETADLASGWAEQLGVDRSELLRDALNNYLAKLAAEDDARAWEALPLTPEEASLGDLAEWGPAEDWSDWSPGETR